MAKLRMNDFQMNRLKSRSEARLPIRLAVVGAGYWGKKIIREIREIHRTVGCLELHSVVDNSPTMLAQCQQEFGPLDYRIDYKSVLSDPTLDAVFIASPNKTHYDTAATSILHGKSVIVEKPIASTSVEADNLVKLSRKENVVLSVSHLHRFNPAVKALKRAISNGVLGELYYLRFRWTGFMLPQMERDVITDLAPHPIDICNYLLDMWPKSITCKGKGYRTKENEEVAFLTAEHSGELTAQVEVSWLDREKRRDVTIVGSRGMAYLDCSEQKGTIHGPDSSEAHDLPIVPGNTLKSMLIHFAECVMANSLSKPINNLSPGIQGAYVVRVLEAARESLREKRTIPVLYENMPPLLPSHLKDSGLEIPSEPPLETSPSPVWDPSELDPDDSISDNVPSSSIEARIRTSRHRVNIVLALNSSDMGPKQLASSVGLDLSNLGKYLNDLLHYGLVERKTPFDLRKGRRYGLTERGRKLAGQLPWGEKELVQ